MSNYFCGENLDNYSYIHLYQFAIHVVEWIHFLYTHRRVNHLMQSVTTDLTCLQIFFAYKEGREKAEDRNN